MNTEILRRSDIAPTTLPATDRHEVLKSAHIPTYGLHQRTTGLLEELCKEPVIQEALDKLSKELPGYVRYHNLQHTRDVMYHSILFALHDGLPDHEIHLLAVAAAWHDTGFIEFPAANEAVGARYAKAAMEKHGYSVADIEKVGIAIMDTEMKPVANLRTVTQVSRSHISNYLLDADLSNFGRNVFFDKSLLVYSEIHGRDAYDLMAVRNNPQGMRFLEATMRLITYHEWKTEGARTLMDKQKKKNTEELLSLIQDPIL